jgi:SCP-2 sterol transfer family
VPLGEGLFFRFVRRSTDERLERTVGSERGLRLVFRAMARAYRPDRAGDFNGDVRYELTDAQGRERTWTVSCSPAGASALPVAREAPALTIKLALADFIRVAGRDLDPVKALLSGRMELEGDFALAMRLAQMFGQPSP